MMKIKMYLTVLLALLCGEFAAAQSKPVYASDGIALRGYDVVAYFTDSQAIKGIDSISYQWNDARWLFKNTAHLAMFKANPDKYSPQYGGFCAYGMSEDHASPTNPEAFTIVDDKLYLNYNLKVKQLWMKNQPERILQADSAWLKLKAKQ